MPWIDIGRCVLFYERHGSESLPPALLLPELGGSTLSWAYAANRFPQRCLIAIDLRGAGRSEKPPGPYFVDDLAEDAAAFIDLMRPMEKWDVFGCALGGFVALALAQRHPSRIRSLAVCEVVSEIGEAAKTYIDRRARMIEEQGMASVMEMSLRNSFPDGTPLPEAAFREQYRLAWRSQDPGGYSSLSAALSRHVVTEAELEAIIPPALIMFGELDYLWKPSAALAVAERMPAAKFALLKDAGHLPHIQNPAAMADEVKRFWIENEIA